MTRLSSLPGPTWPGPTRRWVAPPAGRAAYAIRALRDLCFGIVSRRLGHPRSLDSFLGGHTLNAPARPRLSFYRVVSRERLKRKKAPPDSGAGLSADGADPHKHAKVK